MKAGWFQTAIEAVFPPRCCSCGTNVESDFGLCGSCWRDTPFIAGTICDACGTPLMGESTGPEICDDCLARPRNWAQGRAALVYEGRARRMVMALKHGGRQDLARPAAAWMVQAGRDLLSPDALVVPVPLHRLRLMKRRYNQAALLAQALGRLSGHEVVVDALLRTRRTRALEDATVQARFEEVAGAIAPNPRQAHRLSGRNIVLIDDVMTSGATFAAAASACRAAGAARISTLALARVGHDGYVGCETIDGANDETD